MLLLLFFRVLLHLRLTLPQRNWFTCTPCLRLRINIQEKISEIENTYKVQYLFEVCGWILFGEHEQRTCYDQHSDVKPVSFFTHFSVVPSTYIRIQKFLSVDLCEKTERENAIMKWRKKPIKCIQLQRWRAIVYMYMLKIDLGIDSVSYNFFQVHCYAPRSRVNILCSSTLHNSTWKKIWSPSAFFIENDHLLLYEE